MPSNQKDAEKIVSQDTKKTDSKEDKESKKKDTKLNKNAELGKKVAEAPMPEEQKMEETTTVQDAEIPKDKLVVDKNVTYSIIIDKSDYSLKLLGDGKVLHTFPVAVGLNTGDKQAVGDMRTPDGDFYIEDICEASTWTHDFGDGKGVIPHAYGPWFLSLETPGWTGIGIHGTHAPESIGTRASEGCVRMYNEDVALVKKFVKLGTKVRIQE